MTVELGTLAGLAILLSVLAFVSAAGAAANLGYAWVTGNRVQDMTAGGWIWRCTRAHRSLIENLLPFAAVVLVAHAA